MCLAEDVRSCESVINDIRRSQLPINPKCQNSIRCFTPFIDEIDQNGPDSPVATIPRPLSATSSSGSEGEATRPSERRRQRRFKRLDHDLDSVGIEESTPSGKNVIGKGADSESDSDWGWGTFSSARERARRTAAHEYN